jgi:hypothetical protein
MTSVQSEAPADKGALLARFEVDPKSELGLARLRTVTSVLALGGALLLFLAGVPLPVFIAALIALIASTAWLVQARRARTRASHADQYFLAVHSHGFELAEGPKVTWVVWPDVSAIEVDEEHLEIVVARHTQGSLRVDPRYPGVAIHDLMLTLRNAWQKTLDS